MKATPQQIDVRRYDAVVDVLLRNPGISFHDAARQAGVSVHTVRRIWDGTISRPPAVVLERLAEPRRCSQCGALCSDWPCVLCEMRRRHESNAPDQPALRFVYKHQKK